MNKKIKFISCVMIIVLIALTGKTFAGMADMDDETSQIIANEMIANQEKEESENEGKSSNNYLSSLEVEGYTLSPKFDKQTLNYTIEDTEKETENTTAENKETSSVLNEINAMAESENQGNKADVKTIAIIVIVVAVLAIIVLMMPGSKKKKK